MAVSRKPAKIRLHDVDDLQALCRAAADHTLRRWGAHLREHQREDLIAYLVLIAWQLSNRYDPEQGQAFSTYAYRILRLRVADWYRTEFGDERRNRDLDGGTIGSLTRELGETRCRRPGPGDMAPRGDALEP